MNILDNLSQSEYEEINKSIEKSIRLRKIIKKKDDEIKKINEDILFLVKRKLDIEIGDIVKGNPLRQRKNEKHSIKVKDIQVYIDTNNELIVYAKGTKLDKDGNYTKYDMGDSNIIIDQNIENLSKIKEKEKGHISLNN